jgi:3,4-dihydroxy 2-butanone 4-phosphate synthase/GTP cyclohydrolase II
VNYFDSILNDIRAGVPIVVFENDRESEGDLVLSAQTCERDAVLFAMTKCGGLFCMPASTDIVEKQFELPMMVQNSNDYLQTPFSILVDSIKSKTGVSLNDRMLTVKAFCNPTANTNDLRKPGHAAVLKARRGLFQERKGHTESSIELMRAAKLREVAIIVEIMDLETGEMARGDVLRDYCLKYNLKMITVEDIYNQIYKC